jgi:hypothetical protein
MERSNGNKQRQKKQNKKVGQSSGPLKITFTWQKELFKLVIKLPGDMEIKELSPIFYLFKICLITRWNPVRFSIKSFRCTISYECRTNFECLLGLAGSYLGQNYKIQPFDELYGCEASRSLVYSNYMKRVLKPGKFFNPNSPGKIRLFDGRTGQCFKQPVTVVRIF